MCVYILFTFCSLEQKMTVFFQYLVRQYCNLKGGGPVIYNLHIKEGEAYGVGCRILGYDMIGLSMVRLGSVSSLLTRLLY